MAVIADWREVWMMAESEIPQMRLLPFFPTEDSIFESVLSMKMVAGSVAKWLRQRIANPSSSVRLRPEPLKQTP